MNFNNDLVGLDEQATLVFGDVTLSLSELRYAIDLATLSSFSHALMASLQAQGIQVPIGAYDQQGQWCPLSNSAWFQQGVACEVRVPEPQQGRLKLRIVLEFLPEAIEHLVMPQPATCNEITRDEITRNEITCDGYLTPPSRTPTNALCNLGVQIPV